MGRGLSQLQKDILDALPWLTDGMGCEDAPTRVELVDILDLEPTPSNRVAVTRSVSRLYARGLILHIWGFGWRYTAKFATHGQRCSYARATPEQVESFRLRREAFLQRTPVSNPLSNPNNRHG